MPRRILVPLDGSRRAETALSQLPGVCRPGDEVMLLTVGRPSSRQQVGSRPARPGTFGDPSGSARLTAGRETPVFETPEQARERQLAVLTRYLNRRADQVHALGFPVHVQPLIAKDVAAAIIEYARSYRPDIILMVRRTLDPRRFLLGSVSRQVERAGVAPVLLVPGRRTATAGRVA